MSRWSVNPVQFVRNVRTAAKLGPSVRDGFGYLNWIYNDKAFTRANPSGKRYLNFRLAPPVGRVRLCVRDNRGADQLVFGEVLIKRDYAVDVPTPKTVLDLGGNIGLASLYFSRRWPMAKLAVVEPMPANLAVLRENFALNEVPAMVFPAAVGTSDGRVTMEIAELDCAHKVAEAGTGGFEVDALSIPTLMNRLGWDRIGLLKMDIEGYEATLLRNRPDWLNSVDAMCLEAFDGTISETEIETIAGEHGFRTAKQPSGLWLWTR